MRERLKVNGIDVTASEGDTILRAARRGGFDIPSLCHHEAVRAIGACRICLVEVVNGDQKVLTTACNTPVEGEMEVITDSEEIRRHRATNLELLLGRAPRSKAIRALARKYGVSEPRFAPPAASDLEGCILCELCVRVCETLGHSALAAVERGGKKHIGSPFGKPSEQCVGCGACYTVCPAECIAMVDSRTTRKIWDREFRLVSCQSCGEPVMTEAHREFAVKNGELKEDYYTTCVACKKKNMAQRFAGVGVR